jgi:hypothetical protein
MAFLSGVHSLSYRYRRKRVQTLKARAEFEFVDAPFALSAETAEAAVGVGGMRESGRSWWAPADVDVGDGDGFDAAYDVLRDAVKTHSPDVL